MTSSPAFREMCMKLTNYRFNTGFLRSELLKKKLILIFLLCKCNRVVVHNYRSIWKGYGAFKWIMQGHPFNVSKIMHCNN